MPETRRNRHTINHMQTFKYISHYNISKHIMLDQVIWWETTQ